MNEKDFGKGVVRRNPLVKKIQKLSRQLKGQKIGKSAVPFDWLKGYDVRDTIGEIQIKNQGQSSSCGGQAGAYFLEIQERLRNLKEGAISAKSIYCHWKRPGGGMTVTELNTQIGAQGANLEAAVPSYDAYGNPLTEFMMTDQSWETDSLMRDAVRRAGYTPYDIAEDIETIAQTLQTYGAVLIEIRGTNNGTWLSPTPLIINIGSPVWYHYMCVIGAKQFGPDKKLIVLNSWGNIGDKGVQYFGKEWFAAKNIIDAFTFVHNSQVEVIPTPKPTVWQAILMWWKQQKLLANYLAS